MASLLFEPGPDVADVRGCLPPLPESLVPESTSFSDRGGGRNEEAEEVPGRETSSGREHGRAGDKPCI